MESNLMRTAIPAASVLLLLAACAGPTRVSATPPTVSYQVTGSDVGQAGVNAQQYCAQFGRSAQFQGLQATASGNRAVYFCE